MKKMKKISPFQFDDCFRCWLSKYNMFHPKTHYREKE
jgi:hypothetical protein